MNYLKKIRKDDPGAQYTDELFKELRDKIAKEYDQAYREVAEKCNKYFKEFNRLDKIKKAEVLAGTLSEEKYKEWRTKKMLVGERWNAMRDTLAADLTTADMKAMSMIYGYLPDAYAMNFNYGVYETEKGSHIDTSFTLYSRETIENLIKNNPSLLPPPIKDGPTDLLLREHPDLIWNKQKINSAITQGILQGDDLMSISKRLQSVTDMDEKAALRNARTMMTGAQNAGRQDAYTRAEGLGLTVKKLWIATLDFHTRPSHQEMDGVRVKLKDPFPNGLMYPGDADGAPREVYNCRCTMAAETEEYSEPDKQRYDNIEGIPIENVTYKEWRKMKEEQLHGKNQN